MRSFRLMQTRSDGEERQMMKDGALAPHTFELNAVPEELGVARCGKWSAGTEAAAAAMRPATRECLPTAPARATRAKAGIVPAADEILFGKLITSRKF